MFVARHFNKLALVRYVAPDYIVMPRTGGHWLDPYDVTRRLTNILKAHDSLKPGIEIKPDSNYKTDLGLDDLDIVELFIEIERDFFIEFTDDQVENFKTLQDTVDFLANHRFADKY